MRTKFPQFSAMALGDDGVGNLQLLCIGDDAKLYLAATQPTGSYRWSVSEPYELAFQNRSVRSLALGLGNSRMLQVVGLDTDGHVFLAAYLDTKNVWRPPTGVPVPFGDPAATYLSIAVARGSEDSLDVLALRDDERVYVVAEQDSGGRWTVSSDSAPIGGSDPRFTAFVVARGYRDNLQVLGLGRDQLLYLVAQQDSKTGAWRAPAPGINPVGGPNSRYVALAAAKDLDGNLRILALGTDGRVYDAVYQSPADGHWQATALPIGAPGTFYVQLAATAGPDGALQAIGRDTDGNAYLVASYHASGHQWVNGDASVNPLGGVSNRRYATLGAGTGDRGSLHVVGVESKPDTGTPYLMAYLDADNHWNAGHSLVRSSPVHGNPRLLDVPAAFAAVPEKGFNEAYRNNPKLPTEGASHVQGIAKYGRYYFISHDEYYHRPLPVPSGYLLQYDRQTQDFLKKYRTIPGFPHPGGCQAIGDYLAVPVELDGSSTISFYYIGDLDEQVGPQLLSTQIHRPTNGSGAVGITDVGKGADRRYVVGVYDDSQVTIYLSTPHPLDHPLCEFSKVYQARPGGRGADGLCLLTDIDDNVYFVTFTTDDDSRDWAELYIVGLQYNGYGFVDERQFYTNSSGINNVHFRWGSGMTVESSVALQFYCTDRNLPRELNVNSFGP